MSPEMRHNGYDNLLDAIEDGEGYYLACPEGHGSLPPRRVCPECGSRDLTDEPLPDAGEVVAATTVSVPGPQFADDAPYVTAIVDFGPVRLTGVVRGTDEEPGPGFVVGVDVEETTTEGERVVTFRPR
ncbi:OB-fold domain-containing protein [Natronomonas gomsonensis]|nr:OB-fold domain-containing protein [Natronomonas gomsonensis]MCY4730158.1 OB-fold domain-containing protein [Natronomonas gomsonensis]